MQKHVVSAESVLNVCHPANRRAVEKADQEEAADTPRKVMSNERCADKFLREAEDGSEEEWLTQGTERRPMQIVTTVVSSP